MSTTVHVLNHEMHPWMKVPDVVRNDYNFTDGIGQASNDICIEIDEEFGLSASSAYQIRYGGAKGVIMYNPRLTEGKKTMILGSSMIKNPQLNEIEMLDLGVIRCSTFT